MHGLVMLGYAHKPFLVLVSYDIVEAFVRLSNGKMIPAPLGEPTCRFGPAETGEARGEESERARRPKAIMRWQVGSMPKDGPGIQPAPGR